MIKLSKVDIMATLTIKVATQGSLYGVNNISRTGHAWISLKDEDNKSYSFGFKFLLAFGLNKPGSQIL